MRTVAFADDIASVGSMKPVAGSLSGTWHALGWAVCAVGMAGRAVAEKSGPAVDALDYSRRMAPVGPRIADVGRSVRPLRERLNVLLDAVVWLMYLSLRTDG